MSNVNSNAQITRGKYIMQQPHNVHDFILQSGKKRQHTNKY